MSKSILVIETPDSCSQCPLFVGSYSDMCCEGLNNRGIDYPYPENFRQEWCPLKQVPEKYEINRSKCSDPFYEFEFEYGYNQCIDEILMGIK